MISNQVTSQVSQHDSKTVLNTLNAALTNLTSSSNILRKILTASALGLVAITGLATYAILKRKRQNVDNANYFNDIEFEPNLSKSKRPREEIEEVNLIKKRKILKLNYNNKTWIDRKNSQWVQTKRRDLKTNNGDFR